jgi:hypothetical protein
MQGQGGRGKTVLVGILGALVASLLGVSSAMAVAPSISKVRVSQVTETSVLFEADVNPQGKVTLYRFEYGSEGPCETNPCVSTPEGELPPEGKPPGTSPEHVEVPVEGLTPGTIYHFRAVARNGETTKGADRVFATLFGPSTGLPDGRAYEQASPVHKNGGDAEGVGPLVKASVDGDGITFGSTFGIPGGVGAQGLPLYLGSRGSSNWSTQGLFPPAILGERAIPLGWLPDFSETFFNVFKVGIPQKRALFVLSTEGADPLMVAPYVPSAEYSYAGSSKDASTAIFESNSQLPPTPAGVPDPAAIDGSPNVYAWDRAGKELKLASVFNDGKSPSKGAFAGPYNWSRGTTPASLREGGASRYLQEERAVSAAGDVYFTTAVSGQLYLRRNPSEPQSPLNGEGKCTDIALACTIQVSASQKTNGEGEGGADPAGPQPAAFQAASADGSKAFFTSSEKLTNDANTGIEQPAAAIGMGNTAGSIEDASFIPAHAVGVAVDSKYAYWADPAAGTIGRAELSDPDNSVELAFIDTGSIECEVEVEGEPAFESVLSKPRYVAVDAGHVYWTNTGCVDKGNGIPLDDGGTIGRAEIEGTKVEPSWIEGASNPQGIAVNDTNVYWANRGRFPNTQTIARADIEGTPASVEQEFFQPLISTLPYGVALSPTHVYFTLVQNETEDVGGYVARVPLAGGGIEFTFVKQNKVRGIAVDATNVYWAAEEDEEVGRIPIADFPKLGPCEGVPNCTEGFMPVEGALNGLAVDAQHLYWAANGEAPGNPGNDLYRFEADQVDPGAPGTLTDLTADPDGDGAEVQGVVGASADGSRVYFVANAVLDEAKAAVPGTCKGKISAASGACNLYLWEGGEVSLVGRLRGSDSTNWLGNAEGIFGSKNFYVAKTAFLSADGATLLFRSGEKLGEYDNEGVPELYRYRVGDPAGVRCLSCPPSGEAVGNGPSLGSVGFPGMDPITGSAAALSSRNLSADGNRAFFETAEALVPADTNGQGGCPFSGSVGQSYPVCLDTYEWEAAGSGSCKEAAPAYSPLNGGCIYLISTGKSELPSLFADASASGDDVFFFTRQGLVGQDQDELQDVYDARVAGGLPAQNPVVIPPCETTDSCHGPTQVPPAESSPGSASFVGPGDPVNKHKKQKASKRKSKKHKHKKHRKAKKHQRAHAKGRAGR